MQLRWAVPLTFSSGKRPGATHATIPRPLPSALIRSITSLLTCGSQRDSPRLRPDHFIALVVLRRSRPQQSAPTVVTPRQQPDRGRCRDTPPPKVWRARYRLTHHEPKPSRHGQRRTGGDAARLLPRPERRSRARGGRRRLHGQQRQRSDRRRDRQPRRTAARQRTGQRGLPTRACRISR